MRPSLLLLIVGVWLGLAGQTAQAAAPTGAGLLNRMNQARADAGVPLLRDSYSLRRAAVARADDMVRFKYFSHQSAAGLTYKNWLSAGPARWRAAGENIARGFPTSLATSSGWLASGGHRQNLLNPNFTHAGTAVRKIQYNGKISYLYVAVFGRISQ